MEPGLEPPLRVLIVEDNVDIGGLLEEFFHDHGFEVSWVQTGHAAIELARRDQRYGTALVDLTLSDFNGADVLAVLRETLPAARLAVVTGLARSSVDARTLRLADRIFWKPADPEALVEFARSGGP